MQLHLFGIKIAAVKALQPKGKTRFFPHRMLMLERLIEGLLAKDAVFSTLEDAALEYARR